MMSRSVPLDRWKRLSELCWAVVYAREQRYTARGGYTKYELALAELHAELSPEIVLDLLLSARWHHEWLAFAQRAEHRRGLLGKGVALLREAAARLLFDRSELEQRYDRQRQVIHAANVALIEAFGTGWGQFSMAEQIRCLAKERDEAHERANRALARAAACSGDT